VICVCESEILLYQLYLYTRRVYPQIKFHESALRQALVDGQITRMRQLFELDTEARRVLAGQVLGYLPNDCLPESRLAKTA
jgi:hypothetical protein